MHYHIALSNVWAAAYAAAITTTTYLHADAVKIANLACESFDKYVQSR